MSRTTQILERMMWLWMLIIAVSVGQVIWWAFDRSPPFRVESYIVAPVYRGGTVQVDAKVWRDISRQCVVTLSNNLYDSTGARYVIEPPVRLPPGAVAAVEKKTPRRMARNLPLPEGVAVGPASIVSSMAYECNPLQELLRPIYVQAEFAFEVLP